MRAAAHGGLRVPEGQVAKVGALTRSQNRPTAESVSSIDSLISVGPNL